jgi:hypothetical protein
MALLASTAALASKDDVDVARLNNNLNQLASDPILGIYAQAEQALAHDAIGQLTQASSRERPHALYIAERRVDQAKAAAQLQQTQSQLTQLDRQHADLVLERSHIDADSARRELEFQRMQYQMSQEETARLQQQGQEAADQATAARPEADQARKLAAAQSRVAQAAKKEAQLAAKAAKALRSQMQDDSQSPSTPTSSSNGGH